MRLEYKKSTDKVQEVTLESKITHAFWRQKASFVGDKLSLEVWTHFVGNGSDIEIKIKDKKGKKIEKLKGKVYGDRFGGSLIVSVKAKEELTFTAKLPKHGLEKKSGTMRLVRVENLKWGQKEANRSDVVKLSADIEGIPDDNEVMIYIYEHDQDGAHDFITKFPGVVKKNKVEAEWEYEYHEDTDEIPTNEELSRYGKSYNPPEYFFAVNIDGCKAKSDLLRFRDWIELKLTDPSGRSVKDEDYEIIFADGSKKKGSLDENGKAKIEDVPPGKADISYPNLFLD